MQQATRTTLELLVEKAERLNSWSFFQYFVRGGEFSFRFRVDRQTDAMADMRYVGPSPEEESLAAAVLYLRLFFQREDDFSLQRLMKMSVDPALSPAWKEQFVDVCAMNQTLDSEDEVLRELPIWPLTQRDIFKTFLYGDMAHHSRRERYRQWKQEPFFPLLQFIFVSAIADLLCRILNLANLSRQELLT